MTSGTDDRLKEMKEMYDRQVKAVWGLDDLARDGRKLIELACEGHEDWVKQWFMRTWGSWRRTSSACRKSSTKAHGISTASWKGR